MVVPCMSQTDFLELDTITYVGGKMLDQGKRQNALTCHWQKSKNELIRLTPYEVVSYGVNSVVYVAKDIEIKGRKGRFFLERMASGNLTLYFIQYKGKHFFVEKDSILTKLTKRDDSGKKHYKKTLLALGDDCDYTGSFLNRTWYNRYYLIRFANRYNKCEEVYRPVRLGMAVGWDFTGYSLLKDAWDFSTIPFGSSVTFGYFFDIPVRQGNVSIHPELWYTKQAYRMLAVSKYNQDKEGIANIESFNFPLLIRYTWWKGKWSPYVNLGVVWYYYSRLESSLLSVNVDNVLDIQKTEFELSPSKNAVTCGGGVWYKISRRNSVFMEARAAYNNDMYTFNIFTGINF